MFWMSNAVAPVVAMLDECAPAWKARLGVLRGDEPILVYRAYKLLLQHNPQSFCHRLLLAAEMKLQRQSRSARLGRGFLNASS